MLGSNIQHAIVGKPSRAKRHLRYGRTISILIDNTGVQLAAVQNNLVGAALLDCTKVYLVRHDKDTKEFQNDLITEVSNYLNRFKGIATRYILGIYGAETTFRKISLPALPEAELANAIFWEGDKRIPFGLEDSCYGYYVSPVMDEKTLESYIVSLLAVPRNIVEDKLELLRPLNLQCSAAWHEQQAIGRLLQYLDDYNPDKTIALINVRREGSQISYYQGHRLEFMHNSTAGFAGITGLNDPGSGHEESVKELVLEIQNSLDFYAGQFSANFASDMYLYGDMKYSEALIDAIGSGLGIKVREFPADIKLFKNVPAIVREQIPIVLGAAALALADYELIDFLPIEIQERKKSVGFYRKAVPVLIMLTAIMTFLWGSLEMRNEIAETEYLSTMTQIEKFRNSESYRAYDKIKRELASDRAYLEKIENDRTHIHLNMKNLSQIVPDNIKLELYELLNDGTGNDLTLSGHAVSNDPPPEVILAEFIAQLEASPFFQQVSLNKHAKRMHHGNFEINFTIKMEAVI